MTHYPAATAVERQAGVNDSIADHVSASGQLHTLLSDLISTRNWWRRVADGEVESWKSGEVRQFYGEAASALGRVIGAVMNRRKEHDELAAQARAQHDATNYQRIGRTWPSQADEIDECNRELFASKDRDGCCGGTPMADGVCFGIGMCPRVQEAARCEQFVASYMNWLDQINEQTALAAVSARLSDPCPIQIEVHDVGACNSTS
jgi:hypothetical protein